MTGLPVVALGGFSSQTYVDNIIDDVLEDSESKPGGTILLYAGDCDASGMAIERDFSRRSESVFDEIIRLALSPDQVFEHGLPVNSGSAGAGGTREFLEEFGSWRPSTPPRASASASSRTCPRTGCWRWRPCASSSLEGSASAGADQRRPRGRKVGGAAGLHRRVGQMQYKVMIMRIEQEQVPATPGSAVGLDLGENMTAALDGWQVVSHTVSQPLTGELLLTVFCQR